MANSAPARWNRRDVLGGGALLALALGIPAAAVRLSDLPDDAAPTDRQRLLARDVAQLVIPRTATPGAGDVGAGAFLILALAHGLEGTRQPLPTESDPRLLRFRRGDASLDRLGWLEHELDRRAQGDFIAAPGRAATLAALDAEAFAEGQDDHPWRAIKTLILTGYYTSEAGGSQELRYELVPGRWDADLPATPQTVAWSSDWSAVDFG